MRAFQRKGGESLGINLQLGPVPTSFEAQVVEIQGQPAVCLLFTTPIGPQGYFFAPENVLEMAKDMIAKAQEAATGLTIAKALPQNGAKK